MRTLLAREPQAQPGRVGGAENRFQFAKRINICVTNLFSIPFTRPRTKI
jgi:hypothetical protein